VKVEFTEVDGYLRITTVCTVLFFVLTDAQCNQEEMLIRWIIGKEIHSVGSLR
jgi:hypothetical protein